MIRQRVSKRTEPIIPFLAKIAKYSRWIVSRRSPSMMRWETATNPIKKLSRLVATRWDTIVPYGSAFYTFHMDTLTDRKHIAPCL
jgi:hypothetical protein